MDAVAYIDPEVIAFVNSNVIPLRLAAADPILGPKFKIKWTPSLLVLDADGSEHHRTLGFYPPKDLIPSLLLGMGKALFNRPDRLSACSCFLRIIDEFPNSEFTPESIYLNGVSRYIESHDVNCLIGIYERLAADYPQSPWLTRATPYMLLKRPA